MGHDHKLIPAKEGKCSCCLKIFHQGLHQDNVIEIKGMPMAVLGLDGQVKGEIQKPPIVAYYHARCFELYHLPPQYKGKVKIECEKCGVFSMAKTLRDGSPIGKYCGCLCHQGQKECSLIEKYNTVDIPIIKDEKREELKGQCGNCNKFVSLKENKWTYVCSICGQAIKRKK